MSTVELTLGKRFKRAFTEFDEKKIRRLMRIIFVPVLILFLYLYVNKIDVEKVGRANLPFVGTPTFLFNIYGTEQDPLSKPMAVIEVDQKIYVSDSNNHRIQVFDYDGNPEGKIGAQGNGEGQFQFPYGLAVDSNKQLYVADIVNNNISVLSSTGQFVKYFASSPDIQKPAGLFIYNDQVYVADLALNKVIVFDLAGKKLREIGTPGVEPGQLRSPNAVTVYKGRVYISDTGNDRVQMYNQLGQFIGILDGSEKPGGQSNLIAPRGVAVDSKGTVFVVNNLLHSINCYDQGNKRLFTVGTMGKEDSQFYLPNGLCVDGQGRIYVTDTVNQRVDVYQN